MSRSICRLPAIPLLVVALLLPGALVLANNFGVNAYQDGNGCSFGVCHGVAASGVEVVIESVDALPSLEPLEAALFRITIEEATPGALALQVGSGMNVGATNATLSRPMDDTTMGQAFTPLQLAHAGPANPGAIGRFSYEFIVTAPAEEGTLTIRAAMNAFNGNFTQLGDKWNTATLVVDVVPEPAAGWLAAIAALAVVTSARRGRRD